MNRGEANLVEENIEIGLTKRILKVRGWNQKREFLMRRKIFKRLSPPCQRW